MNCSKPLLSINVSPSLPPQSLPVHLLLEVLGAEIHLGIGKGKMLVRNVEVKQSLAPMDVKGTGWAAACPPSP